MQQRTLLPKVSLIALAVSAIACAAFGGGGGGGQPVDGDPDSISLFGQGEEPTVIIATNPPPVTSTSFPTSTPTATREAGEAPPQAEGDAQVTPGAPSRSENVLFGSARGDGIRPYALLPNGNEVAAVDLGDFDFNVVWPEYSPDMSRLAFAAVQGGNAYLEVGIFVQEVATGTITQITEGDGNHPHWSPDGNRIAYTCNQGTDVCTINPDGTGLLNLTEDSTRIERFPDWTPDGQIVFMSNRDVNQTQRWSEIYSMDATGENITRLTRDGNAYNAYPNVAPNGTRIAYESDRDTDFGADIYTIAIDGSDRQRVTSNQRIWHQTPVYSADNLRIIYAADDGTGQIDLYEIAGDGATNARPLTRFISEDGGLRFGHSVPTSQPSPLAETVVEARAPEPISGPTGGEPVPEAILFAANDLNCPDCLETGIYRINPDGSELLKLPVNGFFPTWTPNHTRFAYIDAGEMWLANSDGSEAVQITEAFMGLGTAAWSTTGTLVAAECTPYFQFDVCVVNTSTGQVRNITPVVTNDSGVPYPTWLGANILLDNFVLTPTGAITRELLGDGQASPDAIRLADINRNGQLVVTNTDGTVLITVTDDTLAKANPIWAPEGQRILYTASPGDGRQYLFVADLDPEAGGIYQLLEQPIAAGPNSTTEPIGTSYGYSWAP